MWLRARESAPPGTRQIENREEEGEGERGRGKERGREGTTFVDSKDAKRHKNKRRTLSGFTHGI